jgi:hypothetical protein
MDKLVTQNVKSEVLGEDVFNIFNTFLSEIISLQQTLDDENSDIPFEAFYENQKFMLNQILVGRKVRAVSLTTDGYVLKDEDGIPLNDETKRIEAPFHSFDLIGGKLVLGSDNMCCEVRLINPQSLQKEATITVLQPRTI